MHMKSTTILSDGLDQTKKVNLASLLNYESDILLFLVLSLITSQILQVRDLTFLYKLLFNKKITRRMVEGSKPGRWHFRFFFLQNTPNRCFQLTVRKQPTRFNANFFFKKKKESISEHSLSDWADHEPGWETRIGKWKKIRAVTFHPLDFSCRGVVAKKVDRPEKGPLLKVRLYNLIPR